METFEGNNVAVIFAGGTGRRMNTRAKPKQFLEMHGKPVLIYTLQHFEESYRCPDAGTAPQQR